LIFRHGATAAFSATRSRALARNSRGRSSNGVAVLPTKSSGMICGKNTPRAPGSVRKKPSGSVIVWASSGPTTGMVTTLLYHPTPPGHGYATGANITRPATRCG